MGEMSGTLCQHCSNAQKSKDYPPLRPWLTTGQCAMRALRVKVGTLFPRAVGLAPRNVHPVVLLQKAASDSGEPRNRLEPTTSPIRG